MMCKDARVRGTKPDAKLERERQLLAYICAASHASQPWGALVLLRQSEARRDPPISAEQLADKFGAITFLAAMQQYDVIRQLVGAVEEFADGGQGLTVGKVAMAAGDAASQ